MNEEELNRITKFYKNFSSLYSSDYWSMMHPAVYMGKQARQRALISLLNKKMRPSELKDKTVLEIGAGGGGNLAELIELGFRPENMIANDLMLDRMEIARQRLPNQVTFMPGNALDLSINANSLDIVYQSTVFTSITDFKMKQDLARAMMKWVKQGGGILWFDFIISKPSSPDTKGIGLTEIKSLFPGCKVIHKRVYLNPYIARLIQKINPTLLRVTYPFLHAFPIPILIRTHLICWIEKPCENEEI